MYNISYSQKVDLNFFFLRLIFILLQLSMSCNSWWGSAAWAPHLVFSACLLTCKLQLYNISRCNSTKNTNSDIITSHSVVLNPYDSFTSVRLESNFWKIIPEHHEFSRTSWELHQRARFLVNNDTNLRSISYTTLSYNFRRLVI